MALNKTMFLAIMSSVYLSACGGSNNDVSPDNATEVRESLQSTLFSFEDSELPKELLISEQSKVSISSANSFDGSNSLLIEGPVTISWMNIFDATELSFSYTFLCDGNLTPDLPLDQDVSVKIDGDLTASSTLTILSQWRTVSFPLAEGMHDISIGFTSPFLFFDCSVVFDHIISSPLESVSEIGTDIVTQYNGQILFLDDIGNQIRKVKIPTLTSTSLNDERDLAVLDDGRIVIFSGTFSPTLKIYTPEKHLWSEFEAPGWSIINNGTYGGIDAIGNRIFVTNMLISGNVSSGFIIFDLDQQSVEFIEQAEFIDLTIGLDNYLYGLEGAAVLKFDPSTLELIGTIIVEKARGIAVSETGDVFTTTWNGEVQHYGNDGKLLGTLNLWDSLGQSDNLSDISIRNSGEIVFVGGFDNSLYFSDMDLEPVSKINEIADFVDFVSR
jgi:hypothetical protein